jgi:NADPH-dependent 2,4-dienoyl-CoA reductase/sulfur reductase-like enzyme
VNQFRGDIKPTEQSRHQPAITKDASRVSAQERLLEDLAMPDVLVVGAGPVGLTLAGELARHGVHCRIVDRMTQPLPYCRAIGITPRTLEVWEDMGVVRDMIDAGLCVADRNHRWLGSQ